MPERPGTSFNRARAPPDIADADAVEDVVRVTSSDDFDGDARVARSTIEGAGYGLFARRRLADGRRRRAGDVFRRCLELGGGVEARR